MTKYKRLIFRYILTDECTYTCEETLPIVAVNIGEETVQNIFETFRVKSFMALEKYIAGGNHLFKFQTHEFDVTNFWKMTNNLVKSPFFESLKSDGDLVSVGGVWYMFSEPTIMTLEDYFAAVEKWSKDL